MTESYYWAGGKKIRLHPVAEPPAALSDAAPEAPVFRADDGSLLAVLPEVRVESDEPDVLDAVAASLSDAAVTERTEDRLVIVPASGLGEDALSLANRLAEEFDLDVAQARFRRVVPRPGVEPGSSG